MKNKISIFRRLLLAAGILLILASLFVTVFIKVESDKIKVDCSAAVTFIESVLPSRTVGIKEEHSGDMPVVTYDGQEYAALLTIPALSVELPVRSSWDKDIVKKVPCRFTGEPYDGSLVIGGIDFAGQFDFASKLDVGDSVIVTDMKGYEFFYTVSTVKHAENAEAETLIDESCDLTLFVKDKQTGRWLLVRCKKD